MKQQYKQKREEGFTIIEVMIVLAIAALILVVVLVAIPQLQRNQRNQARQSIATRIATEINNYQGNNNGSLPAQADANVATNFGSGPDDSISFFARYLCDDDSNCSVNIDDPTTNEPIGTEDTEVLLGENLLGGDEEPGSISYHAGRVCDGETVQDGDNRNFALQMKLEGGAVFCVDNS